MLYVYGELVVAAQAGSAITRIRAGERVHAHARRCVFFSTYTVVLLCVRTFCFRQQNARHRRCSHQRTRNGRSCIRHWSTAYLSVREYIMYDVTALRVVVRKRENRIPFHCLLLWSHRLAAASSAGTISNIIIAPTRTPYLSLTLYIVYTHCLYEYSYGCVCVCVRAHCVRKKPWPRPTALASHE